MTQQTLFALQPPVPDDRKVALASAGTGKTFQLTNRLIALLARGEAAQSILATTFTRHAAGEILHRLLARLARATVDPRALDELRAHADDTLTQQRCAELLMQVSRQLHRLNVGTLDAFFYAMASGYALELGLGPSWRLMDDPEDDAVRLEALDHALEQARTVRGEDELAALFRLLHGGDPARDIAPRLLRAVEETYQPFLDAPPEAWDQVQPRRPPLDEASLHAAVAALRDVSLPLTAKGSEHRGWANAIEKLAGTAREGQWERFVQSGFVQAVLDGKLLFHRAPISEEHHGAIAPLIAHAESMIMSRLAGRNRATRELLGHFHEAYQALKAERGLFRFDDLPRMLLAPLEAGDLQELYFRLDGQVRHLLLDEFQDTSIPQFRLLRPMLDELLSQEADGRTVYIVGDPKQSLYSWRAAEPRLLPALRSQWPALGEQQLRDNWRSSQVILEVVNELFTGLEGNPAMGEHADAAADFAGAFPRHVAARQLPGMVRLTGFGPIRDRQQALDASDQACARVVAEITAEAPGATVGVLVRVRRRIAPLLEALHRRGIVASEEGGSPLTDTPAAAATIALLLLADHPGHRAAALRVATSPLGPLVGLRDPADSGQRRRAAAQVRARIERDGYGDTLDWIASAVTRDTDERGAARMGQLVALGDRLDRDPPTRIADAARALAATPVLDPRSARVRVMTVHASKGLQFDAVVLPDLDEKMAGRGEAALIEQPDPLRPPSAVSCSISEALRKLNPRLQRIAARDERRRMIEGLCLLYVAMTRAIRRLEMIVPLDTPSDEARAPTAARLLCSAFAPTGAPPGQRDPAACVELWGSRRGSWSDGLLPPAPDAAPAIAPVRLATGSRPAWRLRRRQPSQRPEKAARALRPERPSAAAGLLLHAWLEAIGWLEDGAPDEQALGAIAHALGWRPEDARAHAGLLRSALEAPEIRALLRRDQTRAAAPAEVESLELRREWPVMLREADALISARIDRLVIGRAGGQAAWARIIDWKTDAAEADPRAGAVTRHAEQMAGYRRAVGAALRLAPQRIEVVVAMLRSGTVVRL
ncbi:MAG: UvrD-helicase domain-containing protein [Phycisphaerales bacterium JB039]